MHWLRRLHLKVSPRAAEKHRLSVEQAEHAARVAQEEQDMQDWLSYRRRKAAQIDTGGLHFWLEPEEYFRRSVALLEKTLSEQANQAGCQSPQEVVMSDKYTATCPVCKGTGLHAENSIIGCNWCLGRGGFDSWSDEAYHAAVRAATTRREATTTQHIEIGQTWYVQLYERATLTKWRVTDLTDKTIELSKDQPAGHPPVVYRYRRDDIRLVERVS